MERPTWDEYFINFAVLTSTRSPDSQTKVGCVLVHKNRVISAGYNGFCSGVDDSSLPTKRPDKYPFMVHAEQNAVSNMLIKPEKDVIAYVTHMPCYRCAKLLWQNNITTWKIANGSRVSSYCDQDTMIHNHLIDFGLQIEWVSPSRSYSNELIDDDQNEKQGTLF
tara:strand:+ start:5985 stop:6479 length:495 start_codon:yes stop_codon:yes gene_type:complete